MPTVVPFARKPDYPKYPPDKYSIKAAGQHATVILYGVIGDPYDGITAKQVFLDLQTIAAAKTVDIHINSPGGYVTDGVAIANRLRALAAKKTVYVDGEASSIAAYIAMVGDEIVMCEGAMMLVHRAWKLTIGNAVNHAKSIQDLQKVDEGQIQLYAKRTGMKPVDVLALMDEERYLNSVEAVEFGFADRAEGQRIAALAVDRGALGLPNLPAAPPPRRVAAEAAITRLRAALQ